MPRSGAEFLDSLDDGRAIFLDGKRVKQVTKHPAFCNAARSIANLYDVQSAPENINAMTFASPKTGDRVSRMWQLPTCQEELVARRESLTTWAETHYGYMGRSPDHVASTIAAFYMGSQVYESH